jgi:hypothetical protein
MTRLLALALALLASLQAAAQTEIILDNESASFATTGTWPASAAVSGFIGSNYQTHEANGAPPGAIAVDNTDPGFSVTGTWGPTTSTTTPTASRPRPSRPITSRGASPVPGPRAPRSGVSMPPTTSTTRPEREKTASRGR